MHNVYKRMPYYKHSYKFSDIVYDIYSLTTSVPNI